MKNFIFNSANDQRNCNFLAIVPRFKDKSTDDTLCK